MYLYGVWGGYPFTVFLVCCCRAVLLFAPLMEPEWLWWCSVPRCAARTGGRGRPWALCLGGPPRLPVLLGDAALVALTSRVARGAGGVPPDAGGVPADLWRVAVGGARCHVHSPAGCESASGDAFHAGGWAVPAGPPGRGLHSGSGSATHVGDRGGRAAHLRSRWG